MIVFCCISLLTVVMLAGWFRYSCLLLLGTRTSKDFTDHVARASQLTLLDTQARLESTDKPQDLIACRKALERDYLVVKSLIHHARRHHVPLSSQESTLLHVDYELLHLWDRLSCRWLGRPSRAALREISCIVRFFANAAGSAGVLSPQV